MDSDEEVFWGPVSVAEKEKRKKLRPYSCSYVESGFSSYNTALEMTSESYYSIAPKAESLLTKHMDEVKIDSSIISIDSSMDSGDGENALKSTSLSSSISKQTADSAFGEFSPNDTFEEMKLVLQIPNIQNILDKDLKNEEQSEPDNLEAPVGSNCPSLDRNDTSSNFSSESDNKENVNAFLTPFKIPSAHKLPRSNSSKKDKFYHVKSPVAEYIKSSLTPLKQNIRPKIQPSVLVHHVNPKTDAFLLKSPSVSPGKMQNSPELPKVIYKPAKQVFYHKDPEVRLPESYKNLVADSGKVIVHRGRVNVETNSEIPSAVVNPDFSMSNASKVSMDFTGEVSLLLEYNARK